MNWRAGHIQLSNSIVVLLLCAVFALQVFNKVVYLHVHVKADGTIVSHSHPYNKNSDQAPFKKHNHSNAEYSFLEQVNILFAGIAVLISFLLFSQKYSYNIPRISKILKDYSHDYPGRSPPAIITIELS